MEKPIVHPRILSRHPQLQEEDVAYAWQHAHYEALRPNSPNFPEYVWIGVDGNGREVEMVGTLTEQGWLIYHANTPISKRIRNEIKHNERRQR